MTRLFGLETEYGITRHDIEDLDPVVESMELVRAYLMGPFERRWDYGAEDPHEDARGFRVSGLAQDKEEDQFARADAQRPFSFHEMKSDLVLTNGARFYNDHTHPEYSTPECRTLRQIVAHDRAGERIVQHAADRRNQQLGGPVVQLYKNNTDFHGHSYGCHDNYLVSRGIPFPSLVSGLLPFLVSRQVITGAGKVGVEAQESGFVPGVYQLSQRADFMETELSVDTMHNRPILNTRDEPHADGAKYRRLHLISGDANMCEYATALKVGTTQLVLELIACGAVPAIELEQPVAAVKQISRDADLKTAVKLKNGRHLSGLEMQEAYCDAARRALSGLDAETDWILQEWNATLQLLMRDRGRLVGKLDWVTKQWLLDTFVREEQLGWDDPWLASLDLEYHNIDRERGLYRGLEAEGKVWRLTTEEDVEQAMSAGPDDTRGGLRGLCVRRFSDRISGMQWERISFSGGWRSLSLDMADLFDPSEVERCVSVFKNAASPADALAAWHARKDTST
ncbi:MAG TPA: proteasome accessory factor PafA2 family protein [Nitrospira sp.]|nr:proteasome accessory factor PafA2 family protein [Nitrospira sp.]